MTLYYVSMNLDSRMLGWNYKSNDAMIPKSLTNLQDAGTDGQMYSILSCQWQTREKKKDKSFSRSLFMYLERCSGQQDAGKYSRIQWVCWRFEIPLTRRISKALITASLVEEDDGPAWCWTFVVMIRRLFLLRRESTCEGTYIWEWSDECQRGRLQGRAILNSC